MPRSVSAIASDARRRSMKTDARSAKRPRLRYLNSTSATKAKGWVAIWHSETVAALDACTFMVRSDQDGCMPAGQPHSRISGSRTAGQCITYFRDHVSAHALTEQWVHPSLRINCEFFPQLVERLWRGKYSGRCCCTTTWGTQIT